MWNSWYAICKQKLRKFTNVCESKTKICANFAKFLSQLNTSTDELRMHWCSYTKHIEHMMCTIRNVFVFFTSRTHTHTHRSMFTGITKTQRNWYELKKVTYTHLYAMIVSFSPKEEEEDEEKNEKSNQHTLTLTVYLWVVFLCCCFFPSVWCEQFDKDWNWNANLFDLNVGIIFFPKCKSEFLKNKNIESDSCFFCVCTKERQKCNWMNVNNHHQNYNERKKNHSVKT